ncbi:class I SAM-dependent methyltransferase [Nonomuraea jiangxiensis]|uniref:Methyltransferase domain-containing protein n=1 Tax=Nonomuraea jiangxiensis TaxID=633440 RepID=A0A1G8KH46_9ACTN|nr:class I SAM-dependent methyltransferase [Nonomuraea jiangxiensis]SDI42773.1 Methyltransferase domain-containing protein [Nonomuraea jiangxiensis]
MSVETGKLYAMKSIAELWDAAADTFDEEADHGLRDPAVRAAWSARLAGWLPDGPLDVLDLGCGTGSLALLLAEQGHRVVGVDLAPRMVARARAKLAGTGASVLVGDAARPPVGDRRFDVLLARHLLWTVPAPGAALSRWTGLLRPGGRLVLVEGRWSTPANVTPGGCGGPGDLGGPGGNAGGPGGDPGGPGGDAGGTTGGDAGSRGGPGGGPGGDAGGDPDGGPGGDPSGGLAGDPGGGLGGDSGDSGGDPGGGPGGELPWAGGVSAADLVAALRPLVADTRVDPLPDPVLWGKEIDDERYAVVARI